MSSRPSVACCEAQPHDLGGVVLVDSSVSALGLALKDGSKVLLDTRRKSQSSSRIEDEGGRRRKKGGQRWD